MIDEWIVKYDQYNPKEESLRESLCALGNGYFVARGAAEESQAGSWHYPGTYLAGGYNRLETEIAGKVIENEDLVNWPNWLVLKFRIEDGEWISLENTKILDYKQELQLKKGVLMRKLLIEDNEQRQTQLISRRIVSMANPHLAAIQWKLKPMNWSGRVTVQGGLDGTVTNSGVERYQDLNGQHLEVLETGGFGEVGVYLKARTVQSEIVMAQAASLRAFGADSFFAQRNTATSQNYIGHELQFPVQENKEVVVEKTIGIYTSRDKAISNPLLEAQNAVDRATSFDQLNDKHQQAWSSIWNQSDTILEDGNAKDQLLLRLHIFHLFQTCSMHSTGYDAGVPARGWHGEAYRGHILWDELFIFPFLNINVPVLTRSLLMYRYRRLPEARHAATAAGYQGAMFPWQSGSNGREESQHIHLNPQSGRWVPDDTFLQRHVNSAIAFNVWQYYQVTQDIEFLSFYGAEMLLDIAKFWASKAEFNKKKQRYEICKVVGPDEYHTAYPGAKEPGLHNNAYTNIMACWTFIHALKAVEILDEHRVRYLMAKLEIGHEDINRWDHISRNLFIPFVEDGKIIEQFEGFHSLKDLDWEKYHEKYGEILRLDRIMEKENDAVDNYKAVKQADVLMLFYLFSAGELRELFRHLGYDFDTRHIPDNIAYYQKVTSHGSTLSKLVYSWVLARSQREKSWHDFSKALVSDFEDIQGGTTSEGIHLGAMAGTVALIQRCYTGMEFRNEALKFHPQLPAEVKRIRFMLRYRDHNLLVDLTHKELKLKSNGGWNNGIDVIVNNQQFRLRKGEEKVFGLKAEKHKTKQMKEKAEA